jgi:hypothetical protein
MMTGLPGPAFAGLTRSAWLAGRPVRAAGEQLEADGDRGRRGPGPVLRRDGTAVVLVLASPGWSAACVGNAPGGGWPGGLQMNPDRLAGRQRAGCRPFASAAVAGAAPAVRRGPETQDLTRRLKRERCCDNNADSRGKPRRDQ